MVEDLTELTVKARAKINIYLRVVGKLPDNFHELETLFQELELADIITIRPADELRLTVHNASLPANEDNLVIKAAALLRNRYHIQKGADITLEKNIPVAAGLGGGSSDAAATLSALAKFWSLPVNEKELIDMAASLGADIPFFFYGGTALGFGRGDRIEALPDIGPYPCLLVKPDFDVSTAWVYKNFKFPLTKSPRIINIHNLIGELRTVENFSTLCVNDLESVVLQRFPVIEELKKTLMIRGARVAMMTGSGPTVFGIFADSETCCQAGQSMTGFSGSVIPTSFRMRQESHSP